MPIYYECKRSISKSNRVAAKQSNSHHEGREKSEKGNPETILKVLEMEKQLKENGDKLSDEDKATVQTEIDAFKKVREGNNAAEIKTAMENFTQKVYAIFGKLYQQQGAPDMGGQAGTQNADGSYNADGSVQ